MRAVGIVACAAVLLEACSRAASPSPAESQSSATASAPVATEAPSSAPVALAAPPSAAPGIASAAESSTPPGELPLICEAYFAQMLQCVDTIASRAPEATRAEVRKRFAESAETSKRQMRATMAPRDAEAYCKQSLLAITASHCEPPSAVPVPR